MQRKIQKKIEDLIIYCNNQFKLKEDRSTIGKILRNQRFNNERGNEININKRERSVSSPELEDQL